MQLNTNPPESKQNPTESQQVPNKTENNEQKIVIKSSAFPPQKIVQQTSIVHKIVASSFAVTNNFSMRTTIKQTDITQIRHIQLQCFPLQYGDYFYANLLQGKYKCLITQTEVVIQWPILKEILKQKYQRQKQIQQVQKEKGRRNPILIQQSKYFQDQGIKPAYLYYQYDLNQILPHLKTTAPKSLSQNKSQNILNNLVKIKVIVGILIFDLVGSCGYLRGAWVKESLFGSSSSVYINTICVLSDFRKTGIAKKMLQWLMSRILKQKFFQFLYLHVIDYNVPAIKLYQSFGFKQLDICKNFYNIDGKPYDAKLLGIFLNGGQRRVGWMQWFGKFWS